MSTPLVQYMTHPHLDVDVWVCRRCGASGTGQHACVKQRAQARMEDIAYILATDGPERLPDRLGVSASALQRWAYRQGLRDLGRQLNPRVWDERRSA